MGVDVNQISVWTQDNWELVKVGKTSLSYSFSGHASPTGGVEIASTIDTHGLGYLPILIMGLDSGGGTYETITSGASYGGDAGTGFMQEMYHRFVVDTNVIYFQLFHRYLATSGGTSGFSGTLNYTWYLFRARVK